MPRSNKGLTVPTSLEINPSEWNTDYAGNMDTTANLLGFYTLDPTNAVMSLGTNTPTDIKVGINTVSPSLTTQGLHVVGSVVVGSPTGGDRGSGTINAEAVYDDNVLLSDFVFESAYNMKSIKETKNFYKENKHLPTIKGRKAFEKQGFSLGELANMLWETVEVQQIFITQLFERLEKLKTKNGTNSSLAFD